MLFQGFGKGALHLAGYTVTGVGIDLPLQLLNYPALGVWVGHGHPAALQGDPS